MNWLDIVIGVPLLWGLWKGFREGIVLQAGGIVGLLLGVWFAWKYGQRFGLWIGTDPSTAGVVGFILILVGVLIVIALLGRLARGLFRIAGLGMFDSAGGLLLGGLKMALIVSLLLYGFDTLNKKQAWVSPHTLENSRLYNPVKGLSNYIFPYVDFARQMLFDTEPAEEPGQPDELSPPAPTHEV